MMRVSLEEFVKQSSEAKLATVRGAANAMKALQPMAKNYYDYLQVDRAFDEQLLYIIYESMYGFFAKAETNYTKHLAQKTQKIQQHIQKMQELDEAVHQEAEQELLAELENLE